MGLNPIKDIVLSQDGEIMVAINSRDEIICINCVKGFGIWKENLKMRVDGISYASGAAQTLLYSCHGKISILDNLGKAIWEQQFPFSLLRACISFDGQFIWFASSEGIVGLLRSRSGRDLSRIEFSDFEILSSQPHLSVFFKKSWRTELEPPRSGEKPLIQSWVGPDGVEYVILWNGSNALLCLNDCGEEVFKTSLLVGKIFGMSVSPQADLVILVSDSGIIGFRLDGSEVFRFLGDFSNVHLFESGSFALLQSDGKCRIYLNNRRFSHVVDVNYDISSLCGSERVAFLFGDNNLTAIDSLGNVLHSFSYAGKACFHEIDSNQGDLLFGTEFGEIILLGIDGNLLYRNILSGKIIFACFDQTEDLIFAATQGVPDLVLVQNRTSRKGKIRLNGKPVLGGCHKLGVAVGTELDDIVFAGKDGCIQGRYSSADHLVGFVGSRQGEGIYVLAEGSISRFATSPANEPKLGVKIADLT
ncbi:hypothetical protein HYY75_09045 [bacterium]|nr:hypothetical protein [bacterium]